MTSGRGSELVFVDSGAWIALAVARDPLHARACDIWERLASRRARLRTSIPVVIETFTYLDRRGSRDLALAWRRSLQHVARLEILELSRKQLDSAWGYFERKDLHKLSLVDATSFVLMTANSIRVVFGFDAHFSVAGFRFAA